jgi:hypothetical protein
MDRIAKLGAARLDGVHPSRLRYLLLLLRQPNLANAPLSTQAVQATSFSCRADGDSRDRQMTPTSTKAQSAKHSQGVRPLDGFKRLLKRVIPVPLHPQSLALNLLRKHTNGEFRVISGPFAGMRYLSKSTSGSWLAKLLGTYEMELHAVVESICQRDYALVLNVGAAEGYYTVGMARRLKTARFVAFETEEEARGLIAQLAKLNSVEKRIEIQGCCDPLTLSDVLLNARSEKILIIMDVEGAELFLLQPELVGALVYCDILVELHEFVTSGVSTKIKSRFEKTHMIEQVWARDRSSRDLPFRARPYDWYMSEALREFRPKGMSWYYMRAMDNRSFN